MLLILIIENFLGDNVPIKPVNPLAQCLRSLWWLSITTKQPLNSGSTRRRLSAAPSPTESLRVAHQSGALRTRDLKRVTVDTTVQPKAITFPTDAKLLHAAIKGLNRLACKHGVRLRQSYLRIAKRAAMMAGRYAHAKQFNRHRRELRILRTRLGRIIRDIRRKIVGNAEHEAAFAWPLSCASQIRSQEQRQRGWKLYSFHAPEVECIGKGKASAPYEFGVKASIATTNARAPGGQFVLHAKALSDNPYDGHTLGAVIEGTKRLTGCAIERAYVDKGYRGHETTNPRRVFISGQKRGVFGAIKRELRRRSAIEAVIGHMKNEGHLGRCYLKGRNGDAANAILTAVGYNFRLLLAWMRMLLSLILTALLQSRAPRSHQRSNRLVNRRPPNKPLKQPASSMDCSLARGSSLLGSLVLDRYAIEIVAFELLAGGVGGLLVEAGESGAIERLIAFEHALGERIGGCELVVHFA